MKSPSQRTLSEDEAFEKLRGIGESALLTDWETLAPAQKENLLKQITQLDVVFFHRQQEELAHPQDFVEAVEPFKGYFPSGNFEDFKRGQKAAAEGRCACVILAGGQGSRFSCTGPKGCVPVTAVKKKSLYQLVAEKIKAASEQVGYPLKVAFMTSPLNHVETETYFVQNAFFGLNPQQVTFFYQQMWPFLDMEGHLFFEKPDTIAHGPNGNGSVFRRLVEAGIWQKWSESGVERVHVLPIDNPLALPFDYEIFGFHERMECEVVLKGAMRRDRNESVGLLVHVEGKPAIVEYSEISHPPEEGVANLGLYTFSMPFIKRASEVLFPLHRAQKAPTGMEKKAWKFEEFIFDALPIAASCEALLYPRSSTFAPLKNLKGADSMESVQAAVLAHEAELFAQISGCKPPEGRRFELAPDFYYPTDAFRKRWEGKTLPDEEYIE